MKLKKMLQLPQGMKDLLPGEVRLKRYLENILMEKFLSWGYEEVVTPVLEYYDNLTPAETPEDQFFKLIDRQGNILAMRTDMTTPIARMVASHFAPGGYPLKFCYQSNVFRYENTQMGRQREFYQAGVEFIGEAGPAADAEVIALASECMAASGLKGFQISIGHINFFRGLVDQLELGEEEKGKIITAVYQKNYVELEILLERNLVNNTLKTLILSLPSLRGNISLINNTAKQIKNPRALAALENLGEIYHLLKAYGVEDQVFVDFGMVKDFDYYSGMVFEGYSPGIGTPICGGGRYDYLLSQYGFSAPATGFAIGLERMMLALEPLQESNFLLDYLVVSRNWEIGIKKGQELRRQGYSVQVTNVRSTLPPAKKTIEISPD